MNVPVTEPRPHHPTLKEGEEGGLDCFMDKERPCTASCMAWTPVPEGPDYKDQQWANCMLLVNAHRGGKHLVVLAQVGSKLAEKARTDAADRARSEQTPPPVVR